MTYFFFYKKSEKKNKFNLPQRKWLGLLFWSKAPWKNFRGSEKWKILCENACVFSCKETDSWKQLSNNNGIERFRKQIKCVRWPMKRQGSVSKKSPSWKSPSRPIWLDLTKNIFDLTHRIEKVRTQVTQSLKERTLLKDLRTVFD